MILLLDAGNSRLKWAFLDEAGLHEGGALDRAGAQTRDLARQAWGEMEAPEAAYVANVGGATLRRSLTAWMTRNWRITPVFVAAEAEAFGVRNAYARPEGLGVDRWLALIAARGRGKGPVAVVDAGTAITIDVLSAKGQHLGGLIVPGISLMREALAERAEGIGGLPSLAETPPEGLLAADTGSAVIGGTLYAAVAVIDRVLADVRQELGANTRCFITGGDAEQLLPLLATQPRHAPGLVLEGLAMVARRDREAGAAQTKRRAHA
ncbi:MAG TPA: type III pantothenate kinase [Thiotrichales bacterium]|nr:type III pantothenate kinase [Thiotrichales bacterium]